MKAKKFFKSSAEHIEDFKLRIGSEISILDNKEDIMIDSVIIFYDEGIRAKNHKEYYLEKLLLKDDE